MMPTLLDTWFEIKPDDRQVKEKRALRKTLNQISESRAKIVLYERYLTFMKDIHEKEKRAYEAQGENRLFIRLNQKAQRIFERAEAVAKRYRACESDMQKEKERLSQLEKGIEKQTLLSESQLQELLEVGTALHVRELASSDYIGDEMVLYPVSSINDRNKVNLEGSSSEETLDRWKAEIAHLQDTADEKTAAVRETREMLELMPEQLRDVVVLWEQTEKTKEEKAVKAKLESIRAEKAKKMLEIRGIEHQIHNMETTLYRTPEEAKAFKDTFSKVELVDRLNKLYEEGAALGQDIRKLTVQEQFVSESVMPVFFKSEPDDVPLVDLEEEDSSLNCTIQDFNLTQKELWRLQSEVMAASSIPEWQKSARAWMAMFKQYIWAKEQLMVAQPPLEQEASIERRAVPEKTIARLIEQMGETMAGYHLAKRAVKTAEQHLELEELKLAVRKQQLTGLVWRDERCRALEKNMSQYRQEIQRAKARVDGLEKEFDSAQMQIGRINLMRIRQEQTPIDQAEIFAQIVACAKMREQESSWEYVDFQRFHSVLYPINAVMSGPYARSERDVSAVEGDVSPAEAGGHSFDPDELKTLRDRRLETMKKMQEAKTRGLGEEDYDALLATYEKQTQAYIDAHRNYLVRFKSAQHIDWKKTSAAFLEDMAKGNAPASQKEIRKEFDGDIELLCDEVINYRVAQHLSEEMNAHLLLIDTLLQLRQKQLQRQGGNSEGDAEYQALLHRKIVFEKSKAEALQRITDSKQHIDALRQAISKRNEEDVKKGKAWINEDMVECAVLAQLNTASRLRSEIVRLQSQGESLKADFGKTSLEGFATPNPMVEKLMTFAQAAIDAEALFTKTPTPESRAEMYAKKTAYQQAILAFNTAFLGAIKLKDAIQAIVKDPVVIQAVTDAQDSEEPTRQRFVSLYRDLECILEGDASLSPVQTLKAFEAAKLALKEQQEFEPFQELFDEVSDLVLDMRLARLKDSMAEDGAFSSAERLIVQEMEEKLSALEALAVDHPIVQCFAPANRMTLDDLLEGREEPVTRSLTLAVFNDFSVAVRALYTRFLTKLRDECKAIFERYELAKKGVEETPPERRASSFFGSDVSAREEDDSRMMHSMSLTFDQLWESIVEVVDIDERASQQLNASDEEMILLQAELADLRNFAEYRLTRPSFEKTLPADRERVFQDVTRLKERYLSYLASCDATAVHVPPAARR